MPNSAPDTAVRMQSGYVAATAGLTPAEAGKIHQTMRFPRPGG
jgi:hypothetical protein